MFRRKPRSKIELLVAVASPSVYTFGPFAWYGKWKIDRSTGDRFKLISNKRERLFYRLFMGFYIKIQEVKNCRGKR